MSRQAFIPCNITKAQYLDPHQFGDGTRLTDFGGQGTLRAMFLLLLDGYGLGGGDRVDFPVIGSWSGDRIIMAGDHAEPGSFLPQKWFDLRIMNPAMLEEKHRRRGVQVAGDVFKAGHPPNLYFLAKLCFADVSSLAAAALKSVPSMT